MKKLFLMLAMTVVGVAVADTYSLTSIISSGTYNTATLTTGSCWSGGIAPSDAAAAGHDFTVLMSGIRTPGSATTFHCKSLTFGDETHGVSLYQKEGSWTFSDTSDGVTFARVDWSDWTPGIKTYAINGPVTFSDVYSKTATSRYACTFYGDKDTANTIVHDFTGKVTAPTDARIKNYLKDPTNNRHYGIRFGGDLTAFEGTMEMGNAARLEIGETTMPGTIAATGKDVIIAPVAGTAGFSVGTMSLADGTTLEVSLNRDTGASQSITVTEKLTAGTLKINVLVETDSLTTAIPERKYAILSFPAEGSTFDENAVTLVSEAVDLSTLVPSVETVGGTTTFYLTRPELITRVSGQSDLEKSATWSDGQIPHGDAEYLSSYTSSADGNFHLWATTSPYVFPGKKLTIKGNNCAVVEKCDDITISNMVIASTINLYNWHKADKISAGSRSTNGTKHHRGNITMTGGSVAFRSTVPIDFVFDANISGSYGLDLWQWEYNYAAPVYVELRGTNSFTGNLTVNAKYKSGTSVTPSFSTGPVLCFSNGDNLGGDPASFTESAIQLGSYVTCRALASTTLETMNRGISVNNSAFDTPEGVTLTVKQRLKYAGDLTKFGAGTLVLDSLHDVVGSPTLNVTNGYLKVASSNDVSGVALKFTGSGALKVDLEEEDETKFGICNATPVIATDDGKLHVKIDADPMPTSGRAPICTVSSATAASLRGKIVVEKPAQGCKGFVTERTCDDGSVTFLAEIQRAGFVVVFR